MLRKTQPPRRMSRHDTNNTNSPLPFSACVNSVLAPALSSFGLAATQTGPNETVFESPNVIVRFLWDQYSHEIEIGIRRNIDGSQDLSIEDLVEGSGGDCKVEHCFFQASSFANMQLAITLFVLNSPRDLAGGTMSECSITRVLEVNF